MGRDFSGQNLRGRNFRGQDLRGASFVNADIRGANFTDAELQAADFTGAIAGLQKRWAIGQTVIAFVISTLLNFMALVLNAAALTYFFQESTISQISIIPGITLVLLTLALFLVLMKEGFTTKAFVVIVILFAVAVAGVVAVAVASASASAVAVAGVVVVAGFYVAWRSNQGDEKFAIFRSFGLAFGALGGTSFSGADLTEANFAQAKLKSTNFANSRKRMTNLTRTRWQDSKKLDKARPGSSIFSNFKVLQLLTTGQGINQNFSQFNLRGANLDSAQLNGANFKNAEIGEASLRQADLQNANLTELQAVGTDFTKTYLTGACLEA